MNQNIDLDELAAKSIDGLADAEAIDHIALLVDAAGDAHSPTGTDRAFALLDEIRGRELAAEFAVLTHYLAANAWDARLRQKLEHDVWSWEQPEVEAQILELRRALRHPGFEQLHIVRRCQVLTNLANQLSHLGRFIEAIEYLDRALGLIGHFAMALGNRGLAIAAYARAVYDRGHGLVLMTAAHDLLTAAVAPGAFYDGDENGAAREAFAHSAADISKHVDIEGVRKTINLTDHSLGRGKGEVAYRTWCLEHRLFVNPLNDLGAFGIAAGDVLTLPSLTVEKLSAAPPSVIGFFNQLKQEFVSARYLLYEGVHSEKTHFSDRGVLLYNTLDYPSYALSVEKMRAAFRTAYSILDKIAFFLNAYFKLGHKLNQISFRSVWYEAKGPDPRPLLRQFALSQNWPLRGLFVLSKDIFEPAFRSLTEPDGESVKDTRDHLEHKYLQLHEGWVGEAHRRGDPDGLALHLTRDVFVARTLRVLKLVRAALIYLSLAVHTEERQRPKASDDGSIFPMPLDPWRDTWKR